MKPPRQHENELILGLVSVSDRASQGVYKDEGIPALEAWCQKAIKNPIRIHKRLIPDERFDIERTLRELVDVIGCDLIFTTGGTGPSRRDVTPEATLAVGTREMPGFGEQMRAISGHFVPTAILSRQVAVLRETPDHAALIVNLPGRPRAIAETLEGLKDEDGRSVVNGLFAAIPYCIDLIGGPYIETDESVVKAFRPKSAQKPKSSETADATASSTTVKTEDTATKATSEPVKTAPKVEPKAEVKPEKAQEEKVVGFDAKDIKIVMPDTGVPFPELTVLWLHGLGADNEDFVDFPETLLEAGGPLCRFVLPNAPLRQISAYNNMMLRGWFDIRHHDISSHEDELGMLESARKVQSLIDELVEEGIPKSRIVLGGFSQGAAMSLLCGLRQDTPLAGIVALSGYVPLGHRLFREITTAGMNTPVFAGHGLLDDMISPILAESGLNALSQVRQAPTIFRTYDMGHKVCMDEIEDLAKFLATICLHN